MKRRELVKRIQREADRHGLSVTEVEGGRHTKLYLDGTLVPVPRHNEIVEGTAQAIFRQCEDLFGKGWWR